MKNDEILEITPPKLPNDRFDTKGKFVSYKNDEIKIRKKLKNISVINPDFLGKADI